MPKDVGTRRARNWGAMPAVRDAQSRILMSFRDDCLDSPFIRYLDPRKTDARDYRDEDTIRPKSSVPFNERPVVSMDDKGKRLAAEEILRKHSPDQLAEIVTQCDAEMRSAIEWLQQRHGIKR